MSKARAVLAAMETTLEGGKEPAHASFVELGMPADGAPDKLTPLPGWDILDVALFHYVRGNCALYRLSDSYLTCGIRDFGEAFGALVAARDAMRATRGFARLLRECAYASFSLPSAFETASAMLGKLDWMRANAPRRDVEELDLSIVEMLTRMARENPHNDRNALVRAYALVRGTLTRLFDQPLTRQRALPHAIAGYWLGFDALWLDDDLAEPRSWYGDDSAGREELRRAAYLKACELEDGSFYRVGAATPTKDRRLRDLAKHFAHLLTQHATLRDDAGKQAAIARWGGELGNDVVAGALEQAARDATPPAASVATKAGAKPAAADAKAGAADAKAGAADAKAGANAAADAKPGANAAADAKPRANAAADAKPGANAAADAKPGAEPTPAAKSDAKPTAKPAVKPDAKPAANRDAKPTAKPVLKAEPTPAAKSDAKPTAKAAVKPDAKPAAKPAKPTAKPAANAKPAAKPEAKPAPKPAAKPTAKPASKKPTAPTKTGGAKKRR